MRSKRKLEVSLSLVNVDAKKKKLDVKDNNDFEMNKPLLEIISQLNLNHTLPQHSSEVTDIVEVKKIYKYTREKYRALFSPPDRTKERHRDYLDARDLLYERFKLMLLPSSPLFSYPVFKQCNNIYWEELMGMKLQKYIEDPRKAILETKNNTNPLEILSMVATVNLCIDLNIEEIANKAPNVSYRPKSFAPLVMRIHNPNATLLIFTSGKVVISGPKSEADIGKASRKVKRIIRRFGYKLPHRSVKLTNISAASATGFSVKIDDMAKKIPICATLRTELFSGLIFNMHSPPANIICFHSGSMLLTGAKSEADMYLANEQFQCIARCYRKLDI